MTLLPPSDFGGCHDSTADVLVISDTSGGLGDSGVSTNLNHFIQFHYDYLAKLVAGNFKKKTSLVHNDS